MTLSRLPAPFVRSVSEILGGETDVFLSAFSQPRTQGLRFNPLKTVTGEGRRAAERSEQLFGLTQVPWCPDGRYYEEPVRPGRHPYHTAGLYYIQEPSAMSAAELLEPLPGEILLDLAAAPGGKTTHIAGRMQGQGLLVSNEIHPERAKILAENVERMGIANALVTSSAPDGLAARFPQAFDGIMLDAPCSGEGMFRKDPQALEEWTPELVDLCAARQWDIVQDAYTMLKPGGRLTYSTCTFNRQENEELIGRLLERYADLELVTIKRLWPHKERGEGHFVALLRKAGNTEAETKHIAKSKHPAKGGKSGRRGDAPAEAAFREFTGWASAELPGYSPEGRPVLFGDSLYLLPPAFEPSFPAQILDGLRVLRAGLQVAHIKKNRLEPAHALAMALKPDQAARVFELQAEDARVPAWLRGEALECPSSLRGWTLVTVDGLPLGWGKASGGWLKNHYPKGLRLP